MPVEKKTAKPRTSKPSGVRAAGPQAKSPARRSGTAKPAVQDTAAVAERRARPAGARAKQSASSQRTRAGAESVDPSTPASASGARARPSASARTPASASARAQPSALNSLIVDALQDMKALDVKVLDVRDLTDIADIMVIASGTSDRHVRSVAQRVVEKTKEAGFRPHGVEGLQDGDWVLVDLHDTIVHIMLPRVREFYGLEKLWDMTAKRPARG